MEKTIIIGNRKYGAIDFSGNKGSRLCPECDLSSDEGEFLCDDVEITKGMFLSEYCLEKRIVWRKALIKQGEWKIRHIKASDDCSVTLDDGVSFQSPCFANAQVGQIWAVYHEVSASCFGRVRQAILLQPVDYKKEKAAAVMDFAESIVNAYLGGFVEEEYHSIASFYQTARTTVLEKYDIIAEDIAEKFGSDGAALCGPPPESPGSKDGFLRPCPFCGTVPEYPEYSDTQYGIECNDCGKCSSSVQVQDYMTLAERNADPFKNHALHPGYTGKHGYKQEYIDRAKAAVTKIWNTRKYWPVSRR